MGINTAYKPLLCITQTQDKGHEEGQIPGQTQSTGDPWRAFNFTTKAQKRERVTETAGSRDVPEGQIMAQNETNNYINPQL